MPENLGDIPTNLRSSLEALFQSSFKSEARAFESAKFHLLERNCAALYAAKAGSRLPKQPKSDISRRRHREALERFFRWTEMPWHSGSRPDVLEVGQLLHTAYFESKIERRYFVPLDRLDLIDLAKKSPSREVSDIHFGPCEIAFLDRDALEERIPVAALNRFEQRYRFPADQLTGFFWLIVTAQENAGPVWKRDSWSFLDKSLAEIGKMPLYDPAYPPPIEDALFVVLLSLAGEPSGEPLKPFRIPWFYSTTDDPFALPQHAPNPSALSWTLVGNEYEEIEVPDRSEYFEVDAEELESSLVGRWDRLVGALQRAGTDRANFHPLTKHFFVKAFAEHDIDEVLANLSCLEATLVLPEEKVRTNMMKRYRRLVGNDEAYHWLDHAYDLRNKYLHSTGDPAEAFSWGELSRTRWSAIKGVDAYLTLTETQSGMSRHQLLELLAE